MDRSVPESLRSHISPLRFEDISVKLIFTHPKLADDQRRCRLSEVVFGKRSPDRGVEFLEAGVHIVVNRLMVRDYESDSVEQHLFTGKKE